MLIFLSLIPLSDRINVAIAFFLISTGFALALGFSAISIIDKKIGRRRINWPRQSLGRAALLWGIASMLSGAQLFSVTEGIGPSNLFDLLVYMIMIVFAIAGFQTLLTAYFIFNQYAKKPRVNLTLIFITIILGGLDYIYVNLLNLAYEEWIFESTHTGLWLLLGWNISLWTFALLSIPAIISSVLFWLMFWKGKGGLYLMILGLLSMSPWLFLIAVGVLDTIAVFFGVPLP